MIQDGGCFGVNVLRAGQQALSNRFASKKDEWTRFEGIETFAAKTGAPLLADALVNLDCRLVADGLCPVLDVRRHDEHVTRADLGLLVADAEEEAARDDDHDLLVRMRVRSRGVAGLEARPRQCRP